MNDLFIKERSSSTPTEQGRLNMVTFRIERQTYALPIDPIQQIIEMVTITPLPQVNHVMRGVIRYHGAAAPVVSVRRHLGYPDAPPRLHTPIILVHISGYLIGLIVDEVLAVVSRLPSQIVPPEQVVPEGLGETPALQGLIHTQDEIVLLLSLERMFSPQHTQTFARLASGLSGGMNALRPDEAVQTGDAPASLALEAQGEAAA